MTEIMPVPRNLILLSYQQGALAPTFLRIKGNHPCLYSFESLTDFLFVLVHNILRRSNGDCTTIGKDPREEGGTNEHLDISNKMMIIYLSRHHIIAKAIYNGVHHVIITQELYSAFLTIVHKEDLITECFNT